MRGFGGFGCNRNCSLAMPCDVSLSMNVSNNCVMIFA